MWYPTRILVPTLIALALVACEQTETTSPNAISPQFGIANAPSMAGIVMRDEIPIGVAWFDPKAGMDVTFGFDPVAFCGGSSDFDVVQLQLVQNPGRVLALLQGEVRTTVWPFTQFDCDLFTTVEPLASGSADFTWHDNDWLGLLDPNKINAFGWHAHGILTRPSGAKARFSAHFTFQWDGLELTVVNSKIVLR